MTARVDFYAATSKEEEFLKISGGYAGEGLYSLGGNFSGVEELEEDQREEVYYFFNYVEEVHGVEEEAQELARIYFASEKDGNGTPPLAVYYKDRGYYFMEWIVSFDRGYKAGDFELVDLALAKIKEIKAGASTALLDGIL